MQSVSRAEQQQEEAIDETSKSIKQQQKRLLVSARKLEKQSALRAATRSKKEEQEEGVIDETSRSIKHQQKQSAANVTHANADNKGVTVANKLQKRLLRIKAEDTGDAIRKEQQITPTPFLTRAKASNLNNLPIPEKDYTSLVTRKDIIKAFRDKKGDKGQIIAQIGTDSVQRGAITRLLDGEWLNDESIHYYLILLTLRDRHLVAEEIRPRRSHFFKSFF